MAALLSGGAFRLGTPLTHCSHTVAMPVPVPVAMPVRQTGHPPEMDPGQGMQEAHAACSQSLPGTGDKAPYARAAGAKGRAQGKGAESRRAREVHRESTRTPCFKLPHSSLWALEGDSEVPPLLSLQLRGDASPTSFSDILLLRWLLCGHLPLFAAFGHHHAPPLCLTASPAVLAAGESSGRITNLGKEMRSCPCAMVPSTEPGRQAPVPLSLTRKAQRVPALLACHTGPAAAMLRLEIHRFLTNRESTRAFLFKDA